MRHRGRTIGILLFSAVIVLAGDVSLADLPVDLTASPAYITSGFDRTKISSIPEDFSRWHRINGVTNSERNLRISELELPGTPQRHFLSLKDYPPREYTILIPFHLTEKEIDSRPMGLFLVSIGINWEIFINGHRIAAEVHRGAEGAIKIPRAVENRMFHIDPDYLKPGQNILAFRIIGTPVMKHTGFLLKGPYLIGDCRELQEMMNPVLSMMLIGIYLFIGIYHLFLFIIRRSEDHNLYFGLFAVAVFCYMVIRTEYIYDLIMNTELILRLEFSVLYTIPPFFTLFLERILIKRISRVTIGWSLFSLLLIVLTVWPPASFIQDILLIWQVTVFIPLAYYIGYVLFFTFIVRVKETRRKMIKNEISSSLLRAIGSTIYRTTPGNLTIGVTVAVIGLVFDILDSMFFATGVVLSQYSFFILVISIMLILANRFQYIHRRVEVLNRDLENRVEELNLAYMKIRLSEERYRMLVEGSDDIILSMDRNGILQAANHALKKHLGMDPDSIEGTSFLDLLQESTDDRFSARVFREKMEQLDVSDRPVTFRARFQTHIGAEAKEMQVRLEKVGKEGGVEVLGKASQVTDDILTGYFVSERLKYRIANYLMMAEDISHRITRNLKRYMTRNKIMLIRLALREIIINAIEHGNLGITYEEKTEAQEEDRYLELVAERQLDPARNEKRVEIEYTIKPDIIQYRITDEGKGFDYGKYVAGDTKEADTGYHQHGRGIAMALNVFDTIQYNNKGNQVLLIKDISS